MIIASDIQQENRTECASRVLTLTAETRNSGYILLSMHLNVP